MDEQTRLQEAANLSSRIKDLNLAKFAPFIGNVPGKLFLAAAAVALLAAFAGLRDPARAPAPVVQASVASVPEAPQSDAHLASKQAAFAISHLGAMRDDAEIEAREPPRQPDADQKPRPAAAAPRTARSRISAHRR